MTCKEVFEKREAFGNLVDDIKGLVIAVMTSDCNSDTFDYITEIDDGLNKLRDMYNIALVSQKIEVNVKSEI